MFHRALLPLTLPLIASMLVHHVSAEPFSMSTRTVEIPESGHVTYTVLRTANNEISFLPPQAWKAAIDAKAGTITWTSPDYRSMIRLRIQDDGTSQVPKLQPEELRQAVLQELTGAKITEEFPCYTAGGSGLAFDAEHVVKGDFPVASRLAFVPIPGGTAQFNLTSPRDQFSKKQMVLSRFLTSFRVENNKSK